MSCYVGIEKVLGPKVGFQDKGFINHERGDVEADARITDEE